LGPIEPKLFARATHIPWIKVLPGASQRHHRLSTFPMDCYGDMTCVPLVVFMLIETAAPLGQPFPKCRAFHFLLPSAKRSACACRNWRDPLVELRFRDAVCAMRWSDRRDFTHRYRLVVDADQTTPAAPRRIVSRTTGPLE
jgi:hypothetical protein